MTAFFARIHGLLRREWKTLFRFGVVGTSSLLVKAGVYGMLSRLVWQGGPPTIQNVMALGVSMVYNYLLHRFWTFKFQEARAGSAPRYVLVVALASVLDAALFHVGHVILGIYDFAVIFIAAFIGAAFTFTAHRFFTFHTDPYHRRPDVIQSA